MHGVGAEVLSDEVENGRHLLARDVELLDDLVDAEVLEVLDDRGYGQTSAFEHPGAAHLAEDALDGRALGPVKDCHVQIPCSRLRQNEPSRGLTLRCEARRFASTTPPSGSNSRKCGSPRWS